MVYIGTAGYSYKDWIGPFYPEGMKGANMLEYYSAHFDFVEINSSFYHMPRFALFDSMYKKTPEDFRFAVKLFGGFTHERNADAAKAEQFKYSLIPLTESGKLLCLLAQFPYSFHFSAANMDYLRRIRQWFGNMEINIEFRNNGWVKSEVMSLLRNENLGFVCVDEPGLKGLIGRVTAGTSAVSYLRMHGQNAEKWYSGQGSERYDYLYSREELLDWVTRIRELEGQSAITVISFNNHPMGKAVENAKAMMRMIRAD